VTLVKGSDIYQNAPVLTGQCGKCKTLYSADHETLSEAVSEDETRNRRNYLNSAKYIKVGFGLTESFQMLWLMACITSMHQHLHIRNTGIIVLE
jgi:CxC5 like cysteine cluster associated with KDZ transposases